MNMNEYPNKIEKLTESDIERLKQINAEVEKLRAESIQILRKTQFPMGKKCKELGCPHYVPNQRSYCYKDCCHKLFTMDYLPNFYINLGDPLPEEAYKKD